MQFEINCTCVCIAKFIVLPYCYLFKWVPILANFSEFGKTIENPSNINENYQLDAWGLRLFVAVGVWYTRYSFENLLSCIFKFSIFWLFIPLVTRSRSSYFLVGWRVGIVTVTSIGISRPREGGNNIKGWKKAEILRILDGKVELPPENHFQAIYEK